MTVAVIRPDSWDFPLFLHVVGAIALTGSAAAVAILAFASGRERDPGRVHLLRLTTFGTLLLAALPAFVVMRLTAEWIRSREDVQGDPTWLGVGYLVSDAGFVVLVLLTVLSGVTVRRARGRTWPTWIVTVVTLVYIAALVAVTWAMTTKPD